MTPIWWKFKIEKFSQDNIGIIFQVTEVAELNVAIGFDLKYKTVVPSEARTYFLRNTIGISIDGFPLSK